MSNSSPALAPKRSFSVVRVLLAITPALLIAGVWLAVEYLAGRTDFAGANQNLLTQLGHSAAASQEIIPQFTDADDDLVADAPRNVADQKSPDQLILSFIASSDAAECKSHWNEFAAFLSQKTGKHVDVVAFETTEAQFDALTTGNLHVTAVNAGSVQEAVNTSGFVPVGTCGTNDGGFHCTMKIIVPAKSSVRKLTDLKGKLIKFTELNSHSGCKAAVVKLKAAGLIVDRDYQYSLSNSHQASIAEICSGNAEAAAVASDRLQKAEASGKISADQYRVIYESEKFPPFAIGYVYNLSPALAEQIRAALIDFPWSGTGLEKQFAGSGAMKFVPLHYKADFAVIRKVHESLAAGVKSPAVAQ